MGVIRLQLIYIECKYHFVHKNLLTLSFRTTKKRNEAKHPTNSLIEDIAYNELKGSKFLKIYPTQIFAVYIIIFDWVVQG